MDLDNLIICKSCDEIKEVSEFDKRNDNICSDCRAPDRLKLWRLKNKNKINEQIKEYKTKNKDRLYAIDENRRRMKMYGLNPEAYKKLILSQSGLCAICKGINKNGKALSVDHDHNTGKVRGLLCQNCNAAIGLLGDDIEKLKIVISYLIKAVEQT